MVKFKKLKGCTLKKNLVCAILMWDLKLDLNICFSAKTITKIMHAFNIIYSEKTFSGHYFIKNIIAFLYLNKTLNSIFHTQIINII